MEINESNSAVLLNQFLINKKRHKVYFHRGILIWEPISAPHKQQSVSMEDVLTIQHFAEDDTKCDNRVFVIHYAKRNKNLWRHAYVKLKHSDPLQIASWVKTLTNYLKSFTNRPKKLLLFVNPYGGKKKALNNFDRVGKPLFQLANVDVDVILTQRQNQIRDIVLSNDMGVYDAVACVGGDGTFSELFNGLVLRTCRDLGVNPNHLDADIVQPKWRVGVIPGGSTDAIAYCLHGTDDVQTAVFQIIFGDSVGLDLVAVHGDSGLLRFYASVISYGYLGDVAVSSEKRRWMGPKRYEYTGFKKLLTNRPYEGEVTLNSITSPNKVKCLEQCQFCSAESIKDDKQLSEWVNVRGRFFMVSSANISCACARSPQGIAPFSHIGNGQMDVVLVRHTSFFNNVRLLLRLSSKTKTIEGLPFVEIYRAKEFYFRSTGNNVSINNSEPSFITGTSQWNCDGEILAETDIRAKVYPQLIMVFSRRQREEKEVSSCCSL